MHIYTFIYGVYMPFPFLKCLPMYRHICTHVRDIHIYVYMHEHVFMYKRSKRKWGFSLKKGT